MADLRDFIPALASQAEESDRFARWTAVVQGWRHRFNVFEEEHLRSDAAVNSYDFIRELSQQLGQGDIVVTDMGTSFTCTMQSLRNTGDNRLFTSSACCAMGFGLPGAIGASIADHRNRVICLAGDGGFQMNIQELQTLVHHRLPVKVFILNSNGYLAISLMQNNLFGGKHFGSTPASGVSAPDFARVAGAYGITSFKIDSPVELTQAKLAEVLATDGPVVCEVLIPSNQLMIPRVQSIRGVDGKIISGTVDVMFPYLPEAASARVLDEMRSV